MTNTSNYIPRIGGAFSLLDSDSFISIHGDGEQYFPEVLNNHSHRSLLETGADAMAYILQGIITEQRYEVYFPLHYCEDTIERVHLKTKGLHVKRYEDITPLHTHNHPAIVFWNHLNRYQEPPKELLQNPHLVIIEDFVQAPLDLKKAKSAYCFNSLRKFCNLEVAVCYTDSNIKPEISDEISTYYLEKKHAQLIKHYFQKTGVETLEGKYLALFKKAEEYTACKELIKASPIEEAKFGGMNFHAMQTKRLENYHFLMEEIRLIPGIKILDGAYMYLMLETENRDAFRQHLSKEGIFTAVHWPDSQDQQKVRTCLSIHIDHRYDKNDLKKVADAALSFYSK